MTAEKKIQELLEANREKGLTTKELLEELEEDEKEKGKAYIGKLAEYGAIFQEEKRWRIVEPNWPPFFQRRPRLKKSNGGGRVSR